MSQYEDDDTKLTHGELAKKYPLYQYRFDYLVSKYNNVADLTREEVQSEIHIGNSTFFARKKVGKKLPVYRQDPEKKSRIYFPIKFVAIFMAKNLIKVVD